MAGAEAGPDPTPVEPHVRPTRAGIPGRVASLARALRGACSGGSSRCWRLMGDPSSLRGRLLGLVLLAVLAFFWFRLVMPLVVDR